MSTNMNTIPNSLMPNMSEPVSAPVATTETPVNEAPILSETPTSDKQISKPSKEEQLNSTRLAQFTKREAALLKEREAMKAEREAFKAEQAEIEKYKQVYSRVREIEAMQSTDPVQAMKLAGFTDTMIMNHFASIQEQAEDNSTPEEKAIKAARKEIDAYKSEQQKALEEQKRQQELALTKQQEEAISNYKDSITTHIKTKSDTYEFCNFYGPQAQDLIFSTIEAVAIENPGQPLMDLDEAAQLVEEYFEEQHEQMNKLKKAQAKLASKAPSKPVVSEQPAPQPKAKVEAPQRVEAKNYESNRAQVKTINNRMTSSVAATTGGRELTAAENKALLIQKYSGMTLKKDYR